MKNITVILLAGGDSTRFWPLTDKHLVGFLTQPLIYFLLKKLEKFGFINIIIVANKENKEMFVQIKSQFNNSDIRIVEQTDSRGMAGALVSCKSHIRGKRILIISPSDIFEDVLFADFIKLMKHEPEAVLTGTVVNGYFPGGYLEVKKDEITGIVEKPPPDCLPSNLVTLVFDYFQNADHILKAIDRAKSKKDDLFEEAIKLGIDSGMKFKLLKYRGFWGYLKYPWHVLSASSYFLSKVQKHKMKNVKCAQNVTISGDVYLDDDVKILENAKIVGPAYIGRGTIIGNNSIVRESMVGANCVVGFGSEIARSHVGDNCWFHTNYIGDSVISNNVSMGAGTVLANFRLDEQTVKSKVGNSTMDTEKIKLGSMIGENVRIGVNTSIMPGIKIGKDSCVGAGMVVSKDIPDKRCCFLGKTEHVLKENRIVASVINRSKIKGRLKIS